MNQITGGCYCGQVRYEASGVPLYQANCHCANCRKAAGAQAVAWITVKLSDFRFNKGKPRRYRTDTGAWRTFCDLCGTSLTYERDSRPGEIDLTTGSLEHPEDFPPTQDVFPEERVPWVPLIETLPAASMKQLHFADRHEWRAWLERNHAQEKKGIWLVFKKRASGKPSVSYQDALEEALCYGWIDSIIKQMDDECYCRKFTPRKETSQWSELNRKRAEKLIDEGRMMPPGLSKIQAAKQNGMWELNPRPTISPEVPQELSDAFAGHSKAKAFFDGLTPSCRKQYLGWIGSAKRPETRAARVRETLARLEKGQKLGLK